MGQEGASVADRRYEVDVPPADDANLEEADEVGSLVTEEEVARSLVE